MSYFSVALDGPGGAGKSTIADRLAQNFGFLHLDTGALYRAVGLSVKRAGIDPACAEEVERHALGQQITVKPTQNGQQTFLNGEDVSRAIRENEISAYASKVSAVPGVRAMLLALQRSLPETTNVILDGRDIGTVVLPDADLKIYLTASAEARAQRRTAELLQRGQPADYQTVFKEICDRDLADSTRAIAPLRKADDAVTVDTSDLSFDESYEAVSKILSERLAAK